ncbi:MAG: polysaccharide deacetylase family protein [Defluviitaleaceae bacterium]|nr:polysaccharide deacetylase family protein [Defluviitaleaceae bacterium]
MKKLFFTATLLATILLAIFLSPTLAAATLAESAVIVDGTNIGTSRGDMLPLRDVVTHVGGTVSWDNQSRKITIRMGNNNPTAVMAIGSNHATISGSAVELAVPPVLANGQTFVSLCFLADHLGIGAGYKNNRFILSSTPARQIPILTYHHILPDDVNTRFRDNPWTISTYNFANQMRYLHENGFYTPTLCELEAFLYKGRPLPANSIMIHFDDGYYSNYVYAYPILQRYGLRAVIFAITANAQYLGSYQPPMCHESLTWAAATTLLTGADVFETASHTHAMHRHNADTNRTILVTQTHENILQDTLQSFEYVSNHRAFAYPHGQFNDTVIHALAEAGITMAFTINTGYVTATSDPFRLNRFTIYRTTTMARFRAIVNRRA